MGLIASCASHVQMAVLIVSPLVDLRCIFNWGDPTFTGHEHRGTMTVSGSGDLAGVR